MECQIQLSKHDKWTKGIIIQHPGASRRVNHLAQLPPQARVHIILFFFSRKLLKCHEGPGRHRILEPFCSKPLREKNCLGQESLHFLFMGRHVTCLLWMVLGFWSLFERESFASSSFVCTDLPGVTFLRLDPVSQFDNVSGSWFLFGWCGCCCFVCCLCCLCQTGFLILDI